MLRLLIWGDTPREKEQSQEILRLHAQLVDAQEKLHQTLKEAAGARQKDWDGFLAFLRPTVAPASAYTAPEPPRELPGDRPSTTPAYPTTPLWTRDEVEVGEAAPI